MGAPDNAPLDNYDELTPREIGAHARNLDETGVKGLLRYEREHADRALIVEILNLRLAQLRHDARPTGDVSPAGRSRG
jgi:hypothetical protein